MVERGVGSAASAIPAAPPWFARRSWIWRPVAGLFTLWLVPTALDAWHSDRPIWLRVLICVLLASYAAAYIGMLPWRAAIRPRLAAYGCVLALGLACVALLGPGEIGVLMFAMIAGAVALPTAWALAVTAVMLAGMLGATALSRWGHNTDR